MDQGEVRDTSVSPGATGGHEHRRTRRVDGPQRLGSEGDDHERPQEFELPVEIRAARPSRDRVESIRGRSTLEDVQHPEIFESETDGRDPLVQYPTRSTDERESGPVLFRPGRLADEHHPGCESAPVNDRLGPDCTERTQLAGLNCPSQAIPCGPYLRIRGPRSGSGGRLAGSGWVSRNLAHFVSPDRSGPPPCATRHGP